MNSEAYESAALHTLGILTPEEAQAHTAALRTEPVRAAAQQALDQLATVIALTEAPPQRPPAHVWTQIQAACGLVPMPAAAVTRWPQALLAYSGWGVAAALALAWNWWPHSVAPTAEASLAPLVPPEKIFPSTNSNTRRVVRPVDAPTPQIASTAAPAAEAALESVTRNACSTLPNLDPTMGANAGSDKTENHQLIQEIDTLRAQLALAQRTNTERLTPVSGRAWPVIIELKPPKTENADSLKPPPLATEAEPITTRLGDALAGKVNDPTTKPTEISAVPIYDPARDTGTLAVKNLPLAPAGTEYRLFATTDGGTLTNASLSDGNRSLSTSIFVGTLPKLISGSDSIDFRLGTTGIIPTSFTINTIPIGSNDVPTLNNTVLVGP